MNLFQFQPHGPLGGHYLLYDPGAASCVWDGKATAWAAAATTAKTGECTLATSETAETDEIHEHKNGVRDRLKCDALFYSPIWYRSSWGRTLECLAGCKAWCLLCLARCETGRTNMSLRSGGSDTKLQVTRRDGEITKESEEPLLK